MLENPQYHGDNTHSERQWTSCRVGSPCKILLHIVPPQHRARGNMRSVAKNINEALGRIVYLPFTRY
jgi:hypothetical protein